MQNSKLDKIIHNYISSCNGDTVAHLTKDYINSSLSQECTDNGVPPNERDEHPFMQKLHESQDGVVFYSYQDLLAFSEDVVPGLPEPSTPLPVTSNAIESIEDKLNDKDLTEDEKRALFEQHQKISGIMNEILMEDKRKGHFQPPKNNLYHLSDELVKRYLHSKNGTTPEQPPEPNEGARKTEESKTTPVDNRAKEQAKASLHASSDASSISSLIDEKQRMHAEKMRSKNALIDHKKSAMDQHRATHNPSGHALDMLIKAGSLAVKSMSYGLEKVVSRSFDKGEINNQIFLTSIAKRNKEIVSTAINESSLAMNEVLKIIDSGEVSMDNAEKAHTYLKSIQQNSRVIEDKDRNGILNKSDRDDVHNHSKNISEFLNKFKDSKIAQTLNSDEINNILDSIANAIKSIFTRASPSSKEGPQP